MITVGVKWSGKSGMICRSKRRQVSRGVRVDLSWVLPCTSSPLREHAKRFLYTIYEKLIS